MTAPYKHPNSFFTFVAVSLILCIGIAIVSSDDVEADGTGSSRQPFNSLVGDWDDFSSTGKLYVVVGSEVNIHFPKIWFYEIEYVISTDPGIEATFTDGDAYFTGTVTVKDSFDLVVKVKGLTTYEQQFEGFVLVDEVQITGPSTSYPKETVTLTAKTYPEDADDRSGIVWEIIQGRDTVARLGNDYEKDDGGTIEINTIAAGKCVVAAYVWDYANGNGLTLVLMQEFTLNVVNKTYTCRLYYNANGGSDAPNTQSYTGSSTSDHRFVVSSKIPNRQGYEFVEWNTNSLGTGTSYSPGQAITVPYNSSKTLYAIWEIESYIVSFDSKGGSSIQDQIIKSGETALPPSNPELYGYTFKGWFTDDGTFIDEFDFTTPITSDITLYAKWEGILEYTTDPVSDGIVTAIGGQPGTVSFRATDSLYYSSVLWDFGDGTTSTDLYATHYYSEPGTYTASLTVYNNHGSDVTTYTIEVPSTEPDEGTQWALIAAVALVSLIAGALITRRLL